MGNIPEVTVSDCLPDSLQADHTVENAVRDALTLYPRLTGMQAPLASMALRLARAYDQYVGGDLTKLSRLNQELRQTLQVIAEVGTDDDSDPTGGLPAPVRDAKD